MKTGFATPYISEEEYNEICTRVDYLAALKVLTENGLGSECQPYPDCGTDSGFIALTDMIQLFAIFVDEHPDYGCPTATVRVPPNKKGDLKELLLEIPVDIFDIEDCHHNKCSDSCITFALDCWSECLRTLAEFYIEYRRLWKEGNNGDQSNPDHSREWLRECAYEP